ncbi:2-C-methyl-D-erythritol 4-phosphate cytidylyltransferase [candidate division KSB1 bacterium]|nr:2-C-methyl-D-erythritol 4-phosphate cytidylyltransferase [candidate division KSB1 bacterium]
MKTAVLIPAAGMGRRMENPIPKQLIELQSKPILIHTLEKFEACESVQEICVIVPEDRIDEIRKLLNQWNIQKARDVIAGGEERTDSVYRGLEVLNSSTDIVLIHDAVRPFVSNQKIMDVIQAASEYGAALLAVPATATVKKVQDGFVQNTLDRNQIWLAQTPQGFRLDLIRQAYEKVVNEGIKATDDAALVEQIGHPVHVIPGDETNIKITTPTDLAIAETFCQMT